jgi:O-antigen ligase
MHYAYVQPPMLIKAHHLAAHPHNFILLILSEWGIPAGISFVFIMIRALFSFIKTGYRMEKNAVDKNINLVYASYVMTQQNLLNLRG